MKNKLYCFAAIFLIGGSGLRGCIGSASRHIPELLEKANPVRVVKEHPEYVHGTKKVVEIIDSLDFSNDKKKLYLTRKPPKEYYLPVDPSLLKQQSRIDEMMRHINFSVASSFPEDSTSNEGWYPDPYDYIDIIWCKPISKNKGAIFAEDE